MSSPSHAPCLFRRRRKEARPAELLEAALKLFVEKGFAATRSEEVARAAGVSKGTLYLYFPSKEDLLKAVIQHFLGSEVAAGVEEAATVDGPTPEVMARLLVPWWTRVYEGPASGVFKLVMTEVRNFPEIAEFYAERVIRPGTDMVARLLARGIERGEFEPANMDAAVHSILMPMILLCVDKHSLGACAMTSELGTDPTEFLKAHLQLIFKGLERRTRETAHCDPAEVRRAA